MISQYDQIEERVKLREAVMKGKVKSTENLSSLGMKVILQKNKKITESKKQLLDKVIKARKLKIKINEIYSNHFASKFSQKQAAATSRSHTKTQRSHLNTHKNNQFPIYQTPRRQFLSASSQTALPSPARPKRSPEEGEGKLNFFDNFTDEQLSQMEEDEKYYLKSEEMIQTYRKYMVRKRSNSKDYSYEKFTIKNNQPQSQHFDQSNPFDKRTYIINTLGIATNANKKSELHLLTNPIDFSSTMPDIRSQSLPPKTNKKQLFTLFKDKQSTNKDKVVEQHRKKILDLRIDRNYYDGLASEKRAVLRESKQKSIMAKNREDTQRSILIRQRNKTVFDQIGKTIELSESIRRELHKRREKKGKL